MSALQPTPHQPSFRTWLQNPWAETRFLWVVGIGYIAWSMLPVFQAVLFSFNRGRSTALWEGFSLRWYTWDPTGSVLHNQQLQQAILQTLKLASLTALLAVPPAVMFALALHHWHGRGSGSENFMMMFSFVTPELILAVSLFLLMGNAFKMLGLGSGSQLVGLIVLALAYPVVIVRARLLSLGHSYEEAAMDLGASPTNTLWRVVLPLLWPSIFASAAIIFAFALDDFVIVNQLSKDASTQTVSITIYGAARTSPTPAMNAIGTLMLTASTILIVLAYVVYKRSAGKQGPGGGQPT